MNTIKTVVNKHNCCKCAESYTFEVPNLCGKCLVEFLLSKSNNSKSYRFKNFTYLFIFSGIPLFFIGAKYGLEIELVIITYILYDNYISSRLINFFTKLF